MCATHRPQSLLAPQASATCRTVLAPSAMTCRTVTLLTASQMQTYTAAASVTFAAAEPECADVRAGL